jgi:polar amino acid transport system substrate-binding protein
MLTTLLCSVFAQNVSASEKQKIIYFIADQAAAPLQLNPTTEQVTQKGIVSDIVELLESPTVYFDHKVLPKKRMLMEMQREQLPWISYGSITWPGPQSVSLSPTPLLKAKHYFLTNKKTPSKNIEQLFGKRLILIRGFDYPGLDRFIASGKFKTMTVKNHKAAIAALLSKRGVAIPDMGFRLKYHLNALGHNSKDFGFTDISWLIPSQNINICFSLNFPKKTRTQIEVKLKQIAHDGTLNKIVNMYIN